MNNPTTPGKATVEVDELVNRASETAAVLNSLGGRRKESLESLVAEMIRLNESNQSLRQQLSAAEAGLASERRKATEAQSGYDTLVVQHRRLAGAFDEFVAKVNSSSQLLIEDDRKINSIVALTESKRDYGITHSEPYVAEIPGDHAAFVRQFTAPASVAMVAETTVEAAVATTTLELTAVPAGDNEEEQERGIIRGVIHNFGELLRPHSAAPANA